MLKNILLLLLLFLSCKEKEREICIVVNEKNYTEEDVKILSGTMGAESEYMNVPDLYMTGSCILNRRDSDLFPNTIKGVVTQKRQFNVWPDTISYPLTDKIARNLLNDKGRNREVFYFVNPKVLTDKNHKDFLSKRKLLEITGKHCFYK